MVRLWGFLSILYVVAAFHGMSSSPLSDWSTATGTVLDSTTYLTRKGERIPLSVLLKGTTSRHHKQDFSPQVLSPKQGSFEYYCKNLGPGPFPEKKQILLLQHHRSDCIVEHLV